MCQSYLPVFYLGESGLQAHVNLWFYDFRFSLGKMFVLYLQWRYYNQGFQSFLIIGGTS
jgi:hypothetical protein